MRGFGMHAINDVGWIEKERPSCGPLDAIIRPTIVAPCSSDTHMSHGGSGPKTDLILGHEAVGIVDEVGESVHKIKVGDYVAVPCVTPDWTELGVQNFHSFSHDTGMFGSFKFLGVKDGVMAEYFHVNMADANLSIIPEGVSPEAALMTVDMMSTGFHGAELCEIKAGDTVVVIGIGPVGLMAIAGAALFGAGRIIAVGTRPKAMEVATAFGASEFISYKEGPVLDQVMARTGGKGPHKVIIAGGDANTFTEAVTMARPGGIISNINYFDVRDTLGFPALNWGLGMADKDIRGSFCPGGAERINRLLDMIKYGRIDPTLMISHKFEGFDKLPEAFDLMDKKAPDLIKPVVYLT
ncbi:MAG: zinc-binding dehydrogenase [Propionibacteriaceae bacterium]|jgi:threonine dehydrogenase-like Zn-dependent dehydrogenase|nr:zinc-binding dehydrogenase [Propionibacteriaceae bacterium]